MTGFKYKGNDNPRIDKTPASVVDYKLDWAPWLGDDTIASATVDVDAGLTKVRQLVDATTVTVWLSGGTLWINYNVVVTVTTTGGRTERRTFIVQIRQVV